MTGPTDRVYRQVMQFGWTLARGQATSVIDRDWGFVVLHDRFPVSQQHNRVVVTEDDAPLTAVLETAERVLGGAGLDYRRVDVETPGGSSLAASLAAATGADLGEELLLARTVAADRPPVGTAAARHRTVEVTRLPFEATADLIDRSWRLDLPDLGADERRQLVERVPEAAKVMTLTQHTVSEQTVSEQTVSEQTVSEQTVSGGSGPSEPVALCHLLHDGACAQIEGVYTLPEARRRGYASAIVTDAVHLAGASGCDLVFLFADAGDRPQHLYRRLGFTDAGSTWTTLWARRSG